MQTRLRAVTDAGVCSFCWRTLPIEELNLSGDALMCKADQACCDEFRRWDYGGRWPEHPEYARRAVAV